MSMLQKSTYVYVFTASVIFAVYGAWVFGVMGVEYFTGADALQRIGQAISILIVGGYAFEFFILFVVGMFRVVILKNKDFIVDERDRQIVYQSIFNSHLVLCAGLFLSIGGMALGWEAFWVFHAIVLAFFASVVAELGSKLVLLNAGT